MEVWKPQLPVKGNKTGSHSVDAIWASTSTVPVASYFVKMYFFGCLLFNWAQRFLPTKPLAPVPKIFILDIPVEIQIKMDLDFIG